MTLSDNQTAVLAAIHAVAGDGTTPTASFDVPGLSRRQLAHVFAQLRDKGLIRGSGPTGARHVELTDAGAAVLDPTQESQDLAPALEASIAAVAAAALPEPDLAKAISTISTLTARIADLEAQVAHLAARPAKAPRAPRTPGTPRPAGGIIVQEVAEGRVAVFVPGLGDFEAAPDDAQTWAKTPRPELQAAVAAVYRPREGGGRLGTVASHWRVVPKDAIVFVAAALCGRKAA